MRKNVMKLLMTALLIAVAVPFVNAQVRVGDILCEGDVVVSPSNYDSKNHVAQGVVFYVDDSGQHGWAVSLYNEGTFPWGKYGEDSPLKNMRGKGRAKKDIDGYANTKSVLESDGEFPAFEAVDFENGWYLPAVGQLRKLYSKIKTVNSTLKTLEGDVIRKTGVTYWSSTESNAKDAWYMCSIGGIARTTDAFDDCKRTAKFVRSVRSF